MDFERTGWNKHTGWKFFEKLINVHVLLLGIPIELVRIYYITNSVGFSNVSFSDNFNFALF